MAMMYHEEPTVPPCAPPEESSPEGEAATVLRLKKLLEVEEGLEAEVVSGYGGRALS